MSDHIEHACGRCGSLLHHADQCPTPPETPTPDCPWLDKKDQWTYVINAAHPCHTGKHEHYDTAMTMVGNRHSKYGLVDLVNWLLVERAKEQSQVTSLTAQLEEVKRAAAILSAFRVEDVADGKCLMLRKYNVAIASFLKGTGPDADNIRVALNALAALSKQKEPGK